MHVKTLTKNRIQSNRVLKYALAIIHLKSVYAGGLRHLESRIFKMTFQRLLFHSCNITFHLLKLYVYKNMFLNECKYIKCIPSSMHYLTKCNFQIQSTD